ncbi:MAG: hypothetical protein HC825_04925 [Oscillatoriales cyanobacterium RM1_1_9]|nr:hypothetical protein [Oscillatoriales cyanobacterium RM1_1_9]
MVEGAGTDLIADFETEDRFVLGGDLTFEQLTINAVAGLTQISVTATSEVLVTLPGVAVSAIDESDFTLFDA